MKKKTHISLKTSLILEFRNPEMSAKVVQGGFEVESCLALRIKSVLKSSFKINVSYRLQHIVWTSSMPLLWGL